MKFSAVVRKVMRLSEASERYWATELPKRHPNYPLVDPAVEDPPPPPEEKALRKFLEGLPEELVYRLGLLMHLGRWEFRPERLGEGAESVRERYESCADLLGSMVENPSLPSELEEGLEALSRAQIDLDRLDLGRAGVRN